jgi:hypothetical protein
MKARFACHRNLLHQHLAGFSYQGANGKPPSGGQPLLRQNAANIGQNLIAVAVRMLDFAQR